MSNATSTTSSATGFSYPVRVWFYLVPNVLSILCSIFVLYHFLFNRTCRHALNNHVIITLIFIVLIYELTDMFWYVYYYHFGFTLSSTPSFALIWLFIDYALWGMQIMLFAWTTIERHILIFHSGWVSTKKKRIFVHYLPIPTILTYLTIYHIVIIFPITCEYTYDNTRFFGVIGRPCGYRNSTIVMVAWILHQIIPAFIIIFFSLGLLVRILLQKRILHRTINWKKQRKMFFQLISISLIYLVFYVPYTLLNLAYSSGLPRTVGSSFYTYAGFFEFYVIFLVPFAVCSTLPDVGMKIKKLFCCHHRQQQLVHPILELNLVNKT